MNRRTGVLVSIVLIAVAVAAGFWLLGGGAGREAVLRAESVKQLVPLAAAMSRADWDRLARSVNPPRPGDFENQCLTLLHLTRPLPAAGDQAARDTFRSLTAGPPRPADLAREMQRTLSLGPLSSRSDLVTSIHQDRITECSCDVDGDVARGTVAFSVPGLYAGKVSYVANRRDGQWTITEFDLPGYGMKTTLGDNGLWRVAK